MGVRRTKALKRALDEDRESCARAFKALRRNAPAMQQNALEAAKTRLLVLQEHLKELARLRESATSSRSFLLPEDWENVVPGRLHERVGGGRGGGGLLRIQHSEETIRMIHRLEEERETALVRQLKDEIRRLE